MDVGDSACVEADWGGDSLNLKKGTGGVIQLSGYRTANLPLESLCQGSRKEAHADFKP